MPKFEIGAAIDLETLPPPAIRSPRGQFEPIFERICELKRGKALPLTFLDTKSALAGRGALRKIAKRENELLSSSRSSDGLTFYFWLEPKEVIAEVKKGSKAA